MTNRWQRLILGTILILVGFVLTMSGFFLVAYLPGIVGAITVGWSFSKE